MSKVLGFLKCLHNVTILSMTYTHTFNITPVPASRPRVSRWSTYYGKNHTKFVKEMRGMVEGLPLFTEAIKVTTVFYIKSPKTMKLEGDGGYCLKKVDIDNLEKITWDCLSGFLWIDDSQIVENYSKKYWSSNPRIEITVENLS